MGSVIAHAPQNKTLAKIKNTLLGVCDFFHGAVPQQYVVSIDGNDPFIRHQLACGLDWTISSVAGESYRVDVRRTLPVFYCLLVPVLTESWCVLLLLLTAD